MCRTSRQCGSTRCHWRSQQCAGVVARQMTSVRLFWNLCLWLRLHGGLCRLPSAVRHSQPMIDRKWSTVGERIRLEVVACGSNGASGGTRTRPTSLPVLARRAASQCKTGHFSIFKANGSEDGRSGPTRLARDTMWVHPPHTPTSSAGQASLPSCRDL